MSDHAHVSSRDGPSRGGEELYVQSPPRTRSAPIGKEHALVLDVVTGEDFPAGRSMQIGLTSGAQTHTVYGRNEPAMIHYHQSMRKALGLGLPGEVREAAE
jgi:hypothetical protein